MIQLSEHDIRFEPSSVVDPVGRIFHYQGRIMRGVRREAAGIMNEILECAERRRWFDLGLVETWRTDYAIAGYPLVLEHRRIPFLTIRAEWPGEALKNAALCYLRIAAALTEDGYCLKDAHTWNVLFDGSKPYVIDWGSIRPLAELDWEFWYFQFRKYFLAPLHLFSIGQAEIARALVREHVVGVGNIIIDHPMTRSIPEMPYQIFQRHTISTIRQAFEDLGAYVAGLSLPHVAGQWSSYEQPDFRGLEHLEHLRIKDRLIHELMSDDPGTTVLDLGCNLGLHSRICAALGKRVVAADVEETCINSLYLEAQRADADILTTYIDVLWPIGDSGVLSSIPSVYQRLQCDTVLVMALSHHLAFKHHVTFEALGRLVSNFTRRRAIIEFVPPDDQHVVPWGPERLPWYNLDEFLSSMLGYFQKYTVFHSGTAPRIVVVFEKN